MLFSLSLSLSCALSLYALSLYHLCVPSLYPVYPLSTLSSYLAEVDEKGPEWCEGSESAPRLDTKDCPWCGLRIGRVVVGVL